MDENSEKARTKSGAGHHVQNEKERAILVGLFHSSRERAQAEESLLELGDLALAADAVVVDNILQERAHPDPAYFVGKGKIAEIARRVEELSADVLIFDDNLSPRQKANIEEVAASKTIDRTQLILDIFARRAQTREGKLQVELAQLLYLLPRLTGHGTELSRLGGGIGTRGPGETKLEMDRRRIKRRIQTIREALEDVKRSRALHRKSVKRAPLQWWLWSDTRTQASRCCLIDSLRRTLWSARSFLPRSIRYFGGPGSPMGRKYWSPIRSALSESYPTIWSPRSAPRSKKSPRRICCCM
jgi:hypothetical protein